MQSNPDIMDESIGPLDYRSNWIYNPLGTGLSISAGILPQHTTPKYSSEMRGNRLCEV